jgi:hypothetical protein
LVRDHGDVPVKAVHDWVQQEQARFANARVHSFIPVLVERAVRSKVAAAGTRSLSHLRWGCP